MTLQRFEDKVFPEPNTGCHLWAGSAPTGYGYFQFEGRQQRAHRVAWQIAHGPVPAGMHVLHRCDVRLCVNPDHLFLGSHQDNMADRHAKHRGRNQNSGKTHCRKGHELSAANTYQYPSTSGAIRHVCKACLRESKMAAKQSR